MSTPPRTAKIRIEDGMKTYCSACGQKLTRLAKGDTYCRRCGAKLDKTPAAKLLEDQAREEWEKYQRRLKGDWS